MHVTLSRAGADEKHIVENMFTAFFLDLSQYDDKMFINAHGLPVWGEPNDTPRTHEQAARANWWVRDTGEHYIVRVDGNPAGFVIILDRSSNVLAEGVDYELMDFYIAPKYRRGGIGRQAARLAFELHHGRWQVFQLARNAPAIAFWHQVIAEYTGGNYDDLDGGVQQQFAN